MSSELGVERPQLRRAALERCEHECSLAATQIHDLGAEPVGQAELPSESRVIHRSGECKNEAVVHRGTVDNHDHNDPPFEGLRNGDETPSTAVAEAGEKG